MNTSTLPTGMLKQAFFPKVKASSALCLFDLIDNPKHIDAIFREVGIQSHEIRDRHHELAFSQFLQLLEVGERITGIGNLGLRLGLRSHITHMGLLGYIMLNSDTLLEAFRVMVKYYPYHQQGAKMSMEMTAKEIRLTYGLATAATQGRRHDADMAAACFFVYAKQLAGFPVYPREILFEHPESQDSGEHRNVFRCNIWYNCPENTVVFSRENMERPVLSANRELKDILEDYMRQVMNHTPKQDDLQGQVEYHISAMLRDEGPSLEKLASALGVSPRTLRRRLGEQKLSFREIVNRTRKKKAEDYLRRPDLTMTDISTLLGYSSISAFNHAFRAWTGMTPGEYKKTISD